MLINMEEMLKVADKNQFAVGAFNATESSLFRAVVEEAEAQNAPAIVQVALGEFDFATRDFYQYVRARLSNSKVPFVLHLDHGKTIQQCMKAIQETGGFVPAKVLTPGINDAKQVIREKMELFGSLGKAELYR